MNEPTPANRPMRADAQRNYASLLNTARIAVSERGADIVLEDVARSAGVAIGTLYRHFPTRQDLLEAVFLDETNELRARAEETRKRSSSFRRPDQLASSPDGLRGSRAEHGSRHHGCQHLPGTKIYAANKAMHQAGEVLLLRAQAAEQIRTDVHSIDVLRLVYGIVMVNEQASDPDGVNRMFDLVIAGIRTKPSWD